MTRRLILRVHGGLCNRLRALVTGAEWARLAGRDLEVVWTVRRDFGASLDDLFVNDFAMTAALRAKVLARLTGGYQTVQTLQMANPRRTLVVGSSDPFLTDDGEQMPQAPLMRQLVPSPAVVERMGSVEPWGVPAVGLMIRSNELSHPETRRASPPEWFYARMEQIRATDPDVPFFLSTDSPEVSDYVHREFSGVHELADKGAYNSRTGLIDSVADIYLLAGTSYILGSHWSSFSATAWYLSGHLGYETSRRTPSETWQERRLVTTQPRFLHR